MDTRKPAARVWALFLAALGLAALGSAWSLLGHGDCGGCRSAGLMFPAGGLAATGLLYYSVLLAAAVALGPSLFVYSGTLIAAGVHAGLVVVLLQLKLFCAPCLATAAASFLCLGLAVACDPSNGFRATLVSPGAACVMQLWVLLTGALPASAESRDQADRMTREEFSKPFVPRGTVRLVVYTRPDCGYCMELERDVLPGLVGEYGKRLDVERRSATELPGIPTPTLILSGAGGRRLFPGLPPTGDLRRAIETLMGEESHGHETVLEKSR